MLENHFTEVSSCTNAKAAPLFLGSRRLKKKAALNIFVGIFCELYVKTKHKFTNSSGMLYIVTVGVNLSLIMGSRVTSSMLCKESL